MDLEKIKKENQWRKSLTITDNFLDDKAAETIDALVAEVERLRTIGNYLEALEEAGKIILTRNQQIDEIRVKFRDS